jgi:tetratricopeptide (TPR) repeat protein
MATLNFNQLVDRGMLELNHGNTLLALHAFEQAASIAKTPTLLSCLGFCLASEHGEVKKGRSLCLEALQQEPHNALHYLNLGRTYLAANQKTRALQSFRKGLKIRRHPGIIWEMKRLGFRKAPVFSFLPRENFLNRYCGLLLHRLRVR